MGRGSGVAVVVVSAGSCGSNLTPSLGFFVCLGCGPKKKKKKKTKKQNQNNNKKNVSYNYSCDLEADAVHLLPCLFCVTLIFD